jgi:hypothetical protein
MKRDKHASRITLHETKIAIPKTGSKLWLLLLVAHPASPQPVAIQFKN